MAANPFFDSEPGTELYLYWSEAWIAAVLGFAIWRFRTREV